MAYKFQYGDSVLSGALEQEGNVVASAGYVSASSHVHAAGNLNVAGVSSFVGAVSGSGKLEVAGKTFLGDSLLPNQDGEIDLGSSAKEFKDLYIDGVAYIDSLQADQLGAALDANSQAITNVNIDSGAIDNAVIGANTAAAATFTTVGTSGDVTAGADVIMSQGNNVYLAGDGSSAKIVSTGGNAVSIFGAKVVFNGSAIEPDTDNGGDLGSSSKEFKDLYLDGIAYIDDLRADQLGAALDANSQAITNINVDSGAIDGTVIGANSVAAGSFAALVGTTGTFSGVLKTDDATEATSTTDGSLQTDGGLSVAKSAVIGDDLDLLSDAAVLNFGADKDVNLTHVADTGVLLNSSMQMQFGDSGTYIHQSADGVLDLVADSEIEINATTVDINGAIDASSTIVAASSITAGSSFIIGSADLNEADLEQIDGITAGTAAASKAMVLDANKDIAGVRDMSGRKATLSSLTSGRLVTAGTSGLLEDQAALQYDDDRSGYDGYLTLMVSSSASGSSHLQDGSMQILDESGNPQLWIYKDTAMIPAAGDAAMVAADSLYFFDATDNTMKREAVGDFSTLIAGAGLGVASSQLKLALDELSDAAVASGDKFAFVDATDDSSKLESIDDMASFFAGAGLAAASGVLKLDFNELSALGSAGVVAADQLVFVDATDDSSKKVTMTNFLTSIAGAGISVSAGKLISDASPTPQNIGDSAGTLAEGMNWSSANFTAARTWTLPASPDAGDVVSVKAPANAGTYNLTVLKAGSQTIDGLTQVVIESDHGALELVFVGSDKWVIR